MIKVDIKTQFYIPIPSHPAPFLLEEAMFLTETVLKYFEEAPYPYHQSS